MQSKYVLEKIGMEIASSTINKMLIDVFGYRVGKVRDLSTPEIIEKEEAREKELAIIEQVIVNYDRRAKNISLIEFQSLLNEIFKEKYANYLQKDEIITNLK